LEATSARAGAGLACAPPPELRIALLGIRCEASCYDLQLIEVAMSGARELMRSAPRGSVPWVQGVVAYIEGTMVAGGGDGGMEDLRAGIALLREVDPAPEIVGRMAFGFLASICILDNLGHVREATALEARFVEVVRAAEDGE